MIAQERRHIRCRRQRRIAVVVSEDQSARIPLFVVKAVADKMQNVYGFPEQAAAQPVQCGRFQPLQHQPAGRLQRGQGLTQPVPLLLHIQPVHIRRTDQHSQHPQRRLHVQGLRFGQIQGQIAHNLCAFVQGQKAACPGVVEEFPGQGGQFGGAIQAQIEAQPVAVVHAGQAAVQGSPDGSRKEGVEEGRAQPTHLLCVRVTALPAVDVRLVQGQGKGILGLTDGRAQHFRPVAAPVVIGEGDVKRAVMTGKRHWAVFPCNVR